MDIELKNILTDLYQIDPKLKQHEVELTKIIEEIIKSKPKVKFDESFRQSLRDEIMKRIAVLKFETNNVNIKSMFKFDFSKFSYKFSYIAAGIAVLALLVVPIVDYFMGTKLSNQAIKLSLSEGVSPLGKRAFGDLVFNVNQAALTAQGSGQGLGIGSVSESVNLSAVDQARPQSGGGGVGAIMLAPVGVKFVYKGDDLVLPTDMPVLRRIKDNKISSQLGSLLSGVDFGLLNFGSFRNLNIQNLSVVEDRDWGYSIDVNLMENMISMNENWIRWDNPQAKCRDQRCFDSYRLQLSDILDNETIIEITNSFLDDYGISLASYSEPKINDNWRFFYARAEDKTNYYIPETIQVIYPLEIDGLTVYEQAGHEAGLSVNVNIRHKRASGLWNLVPLNFQSSIYELTTDTGKVLEIASRGGLYNYYPYDDRQVLEASLGTPTVGYMKYWHYQNNETGELYVPALIFPILDYPEEAYYKGNTVVVPIVQEFLDSEDIMTRPVPLPAVEPMMIDFVESELEVNTE